MKKADVWRCNIISLIIAVIIIIVIVIIISVIIKITLCWWIKSAAIQPLHRRLFCTIQFCFDGVEKKSFSGFPTLDVVTITHNFCSTWTVNEEFPMRDLSIKSEKAGIWKSWKVDSIRAGFHWPRKVQTKFQLPEHEIEFLWSDFWKTSTWKEDSGGLIQFFCFWNDSLWGGCDDSVGTNYKANRNDITNSVWSRTLLYFHIVVSVSQAWHLNSSQ